MPGALGASGPHAPGRGEKDNREGTFLLPGGNGSGGEQVFKLSFVRDPLTRFVSAYSALLAARRLPPSLLELSEPMRAQHFAKRVLAGRHLPDGDMLLSQVRTARSENSHLKAKERHVGVRRGFAQCMCTAST